MKFEKLIDTRPSAQDIYHLLCNLKNFIIVFTEASHWSLFYARLIHSTPSSHLISLRSRLILPSHLHLCLQRGLFHSGFFFDKIFYMHLKCLFPVHSASPTHLILLLLYVRRRAQIMKHLLQISPS
jgi:hypothetical protein